jgi:hypothetical protein
MLQVFNYSPCNITRDWIKNGIITLSGWSLRSNISVHGHNCYPGNWYYVPVSGRLAEKFPDSQGLVDTIGRWKNGPTCTGYQCLCIVTQLYGMGWDGGMGLWSLPSALHSLKIIIEIYSRLHRVWCCLLGIQVCTGLLMQHGEGQSREW